MDLFSLDNEMQQMLIANQTNETLNHALTEAETGTYLVQILLDILIYSIFVIVMFSMGCSVSLTELKKHLSRPYGVSIGMACQFVLMPLSGLCLIKIFSIEGLLATGILLTSSCPGGTVSNVFTYFTEGDISLSVAMTSISGIMALVAMPSNIWIYSQFVETGEAKVPYHMIILTTAFTIPPTFVGYLFKCKWPKLAPLVTKYGSITGMIAIVLCISLGCYDKPEIYLQAPPELYGAVFLLPPVGLSFAYLVCYVFQRPSNVCRTVAIEASMQSVGLALAVASLSFPREIVRPVMLYPSLYAVTMLITGSILCLIYQAVKRLKVKKVDDVTKC